MQPDSPTPSVPPGPPPPSAPPPGPPPSPPSAPPYVGQSPAPVSWAPGSPTPARRSRRRWVIGCGLLLLLVIVGIGACTVLVVRNFGAGFSVIANAQGDITTFSASNVNGRTTITFRAARGLDESDGVFLACEVIKPTLANSDLASADWVLVTPAGDVLASNATPCGP